MSTLSNIFTLTGLTLEEAIQQLDQELPAGAYKALPGAVDLTDIDPNWMRKTLNHVFGLCGLGWGYEYDPANLEYRYESRTNAKGNEYGVYAAILTHLRFWYKLVDGNIQYNCSVHATGASENANIAYAMKGAITNALGNAVSNIGFQESVYLGLRSHKDFQPAPNGNGNGKAYAPKPVPAPAPKPQPAPAAAEPAGEGELADPGQTVIHFGKQKDKTIAEVWQSGPVGQGWVRWCANTDGKGFDPQGKPENVHLQRMARAFLALQAAYAG
ncbi:hypothetical protein BECAL_03391 [Bellilinea caldifistulae]|jgi:hypothetical protein|uniref:Uncharacterized protein n=1 Tax=Bellilinea caldifistulae TaxID=360411 RepID=A0A0P6X253_9CHLR|nr:hypothetical protein [Bellilinea caldifistulae]KPL76616.1 hypothetical protein AC812_04655 [Bellilinea caldifistulae]GAP12187.1 hypothetical protein BECAL_03391 [Bellilinea caldifistulae]